MRTPFPDKVQGMGDEEARKEVWKGKVAVCFTLDESEVDHSFGKEHPEPVYVSSLFDTAFIISTWIEVTMWLYTVIKLIIRFPQ